MKFSEMNVRQRKAFLNIKYASNWLLGGLENDLMDYNENSVEYQNSYRLLHDHQCLVEILYKNATTEYYEEGYCCFNPKVCQKILRDINFCGKEWLMEQCEERINKEGY